MGKTIVILIDHGLNGKCVAKDLRDELSKINLVVSRAASTGGATLSVPCSYSVRRYSIRTA